MNLEHSKPLHHWRENQSNAIAIEMHNLYKNFFTDLHREITHSNSKLVELDFLSDYTLDL
jgi:hypothetical protein